MLRPAGQPGCNFQASLIAALPNEDAMLTHIFILKKKKIGY